MTRYVLGIDGGGTKTQAAIVDETGRVCGAGLGGPSNYDDVGVATARTNVAQAVNTARHKAGMDTVPFAAVFLGMAGVVSPRDRTVIRNIAHDLDLAPAAQVGVDHDLRTALAGGLLGCPGIVLIAGTGSACYGRNAAGASWRAGGWGHLIADEGSSYWLGVRAIRAAVRAADGRIVRTPLLERVLDHFHLAQIDDIMHYLYVGGPSRAELARLAPLVIDTARAGDPAACELIRRGTQALADCVVAVAKQLDVAARPCDLVLVGGLFRAGAIVVDPLRTAVHDQLPLCRISFPELPPVLGACVLALQMLDIPVNGPVAATLREHSRTL